MSTELSFTDAVRKSKIKQPTQTQFDIDKWKSIYEKKRTPNLQDENLYKSGCWFYEKLNAVRETLNNMEKIGKEKELSSRLYTAIINREYTVATKDLWDAEPINDELILVGNIIEKKSPIGHGGRMISPEAIVETSVSAIRYPLSEIFNQQNDSLIINHSDLEILAILIKTINLAAQYDTYSDYWAECLWNDWFIEESEEFDIICPPDSSKHIAQILSKHRVGSLMMESVWRTMTAWDKLPEITRNILNKRKLITKIIRKNSNTELEIGTKEPTSSPPRQLLFEILAEEIYWDELLLEPLPKVGGANIRSILSVYRVISSLGELIYKDIPSDTEIKSLDKLLQYSPIFKLSNIEIAVEESTGLDKNTIKSIINTLTFNGNVNMSTWYFPIIPISQTDISFLLPVVNVPNLIRSIEFWMKRGGLDLGKRGRLFEEKFEKDIKCYCNNSTFFKNSIIDKGKFSFGSNFEEIDFLLIFNNTVLVGEIKCSIFPSTPMETYNYYEVLFGAAKQADRKAAFLKENINNFAARYATKTSFEIEKIKFIPIVITNIHHGVGVPVDKIPIVDSHILMNFINGYQDFFVETSTDGSVEPRITKKFYSTLKEAEDNIYSYLMNPPLFNIMSKIIDIEFIPFFKMNAEEKPAVIERHFVNESKWLIGKNGDSMGG